jgi:hypothetical protein
VGMPRRRRGGGSRKMPEQRPPHERVGKKVTEHLHLEASRFFPISLLAALARFFLFLYPTPRPTPPRPAPRRDDARTPSEAARLRALWKIESTKSDEEDHCCVVFTLNGLRYRLVSPALPVFGFSPLSRSLPLSLSTYLIFLPN